MPVGLGVLGASKLKIFNILTAGNALKCILSQSKGHDRKNFPLASLAHFAALSLGLQKFSAALASRPVIEKRKGSTKQRVKLATANKEYPKQHFLNYING